MQQRPAHPPCAVGHGGYSAKFTLVAGSCTGTGCETTPSATSGSCIRSGDIIGVDKYRPAVAGGSQTVYLKAEPLAEETYGAVFGDVAPGLGSGSLASPTRDAQFFCNVPTITDLTGTTLLGDALTYKFSNVKFYMTGAVPGTQFKADLTLVGTDCTARYTVDALYPVVFCPEMIPDPSTPGSFIPSGGPDNVPTSATYTNSCDAPDQWWSFVQANPLFDMQCGAAGNMAKDWPSDLFEVGAPRWLCVPKGAVPSLKP